MPATGPTSPSIRWTSEACSRRHRAVCQVRAWMSLRFHTTMSYWPSCSRLVRFCLSDRVEAGAAAPGVVAAEDEGEVAVEAAAVGPGEAGAVVAGAEGRGGGRGALARVGGAEARAAGG